ncbi:MAG: FAD:protein FMN transferase, partial [Spirochaetota bacterium]
MRKILLLLTAFSVLITGCNENRTFTQSRFLMGTLVTITLQHTSSEKANAAFNFAFNEIARIEKLMSPYNPHSDIYRANHSGSDPVKITDETFTLIREALRISGKTRGAFDITYASIADLWNYNNDNFSPPSRTIINSRMRSFNYRNIILNTEKKTITLKNNAKIGLGGIAKGYAIKKAVQTLKQMNITGGIVEAGGDLQVIGKKLEKPWKIGIQHPRKKNDLAATLELHDDDSVATSGDYQRFRMHNGKRYHHIIDPGTGF